MAGVSGCDDKSPSNTASRDRSRYSMVYMNYSMVSMKESMIHERMRNRETFLAKASKNESASSDGRPAR